MRMPTRNRTAKATPSSCQRRGNCPNQRTNPAKRRRGRGRRAAGTAAVAGPAPAYLGGRSGKLITLQVGQHIGHLGWLSKALRRPFGEHLLQDSSQLGRYVTAKLSERGRVRRLMAEQLLGERSARKRRLAR